MSWKARSVELPGPHVNTVHLGGPDYRDQLFVQHYVAADGGKHYHVQFRRPHETDPTGYGHIASFTFPALGDPEKAYVHEPLVPFKGRNKFQPPPSETLRALIEEHHKHAPNDSSAWMPLLDRLVEEYPDLTHAVDAHTAARARS